MKRKLNRMWRIWTLLATVMCLSAVMSLASNAASGASTVQVEYYGRYALSREPNAKVLLHVYDQLVAGVEASAEKISVYDGENPLTFQELQVAFDAYSRDHTEHFWLGNSYQYEYDDFTVLNIYPSYLLSGSSLQTAKVNFEKAVNNLLAGVDNSMSDFQKELVLHDRLAQKVVYTEAANAHNAYGAIVEGEAVCEGYAEALQYLLQRVGIQSYIALGEGLNLSTGSTEAHAWNYVRIDGAYYQTDLTWNDQEEAIYHAYFNLTDSAIGEDHLASDAVYELPKCNSTAAHYFTVKGGMLAGNSYSADVIADRLKDGGMRTSVYITDSVNGFINWMNENILDIAEKAGVRGQFTYSCNCLGRELYLFIDANCSHTALTYVSAQSATCTAEGNHAYYICSCGRWFSDKAANNEITDYSSVIIEAKKHDYTEKITDTAHWRSSAENCQSYDTYWYDCSRCAVNAKNDFSASDKYYNGTNRGEHQFTEKLADAAHLVAGSGNDCRHAKQYYYDCAHCAKKGTAVWTSDTYGDHQMSAEWISDGNFHFHKCLVDGCTQHSAKTACSGGTATCTNKAVCRVCNNEYGTLAAHHYGSDWKSDESSHWIQCTLCTSRKGGAAHTPGAAATETTPQTCTVCSAVLSPATGHKTHTPDERWESDSTHHWHPCAQCGELQLSKGTHSYDNSCDGDCNECGAVRTPADHVYDNDCDPSCNVCGAERTANHRYGATWIYTQDSHWHRCDLCGEKADSGSHTPGIAATETAPQTCTVCGYIIQSAIGHTTHTPKTQWESDDTHHWHGCTGCNDRQFEKDAHSYDNLCDTACNICNAPRMAAEHEYDNACDGDCNECGAVRTPADHVYDNDCDPSCNECSAERTVSHNYQSEWKFDETHHWHECECQAKADEAVHADPNGEGKCWQCGYAMPMGSNSPTAPDPTPPTDDSTDATIYNGVAVLVIGIAALVGTIGSIVVIVMYRKMKSH